jgi:hypothetical protein
VDGGKISGGLFWEKPSHAFGGQAIKVDQACHFCTTLWIDKIGVLVLS